MTAARACTKCQIVTLYQKCPFCGRPTKSKRKLYSDAARADRYGHYQAAAIMRDAARLIARAESLRGHRRRSR